MLRIFKKARLPWLVSLVALGVAMLDVVRPIAGYIILGIAGAIGVWMLKDYISLPPLSKAVRKSKIVWGCWFTGERVLEQDLVEKYSSIKRILLLDPVSEEFKEHLRNSLDSRDKASRTVRELTRKAKQRGIDIKWYSKGYRQYTMTIFDPNITPSGKPDSDSAWICQQKLLPQHSREDRPKDRYSKRRTETEFLALLDIFSEIWDTPTTREPKPKEYEQDRESTTIYWNRI